MYNNKLFLILMRKYLYFNSKYDRILEIWEPVERYAKVVYPKYFVYTLFLRVNTTFVTISHKVLNVAVH